MSTRPKRISVIIPAFNEQSNLPVLRERLTTLLDEQSDYDFEVILVDDHSSDHTPDLVRSWVEDDARVRLIRLSRNFGSHAAFHAGLTECTGDAATFLAADLQDPPEVILDMIKKWREGYEVVYAVRTEREGESWFKEFTASLFYRLIYRITDVDIPLDTGDFRLLDRKVVNVMGQMRERHRFLRGMSVWVGFKQTGVEYKRAARMAGETKYPIRKMVKFATDAITSFSYFPLQLAMYIGFVSAGISILVIPIVVIMRLAGSQAFFGQASTLIAVLFLGGVQLISLGILGEYIGRLYDEAKGRPLYIVSECPLDDQGDNS